MHRMNSVVVPLFVAVLACTACSRTDYEREKMREGRGTMERTEQVGTTTTTGAALDEQNAKDKDKIRQDALAEGKAQGKDEAKAECDAAHPEKKAVAPAPKKAKPKEKDKDTTSMTAPIPTPMPPSPPPPAADEQTSTTTITSAPAMSPEPKQEVNQSTTLGNGQSGMYTGGAGSYGGTATWGTGTKK